MLRLQNEITTIAFSCYKKKRTLAVAAPPWLTNEIKITRNNVRALRRFQNQQDTDLKLQQHIQVKKEKAKLKKLIHKTKTKTWREYCSRATDTYG